MTKIVMLETVRPAVQPNLLFVLLHADDGRIGLGEAFFGAQVVEEYLHVTVAEVLLRCADPTPERVAREISSYLGYQGAGVETRGNAAVDLALWDLLGQQTGRPLAYLLGGPVRASAPIYNTCAGAGYVATHGRQSSDNWGLGQAHRERRWEDLDAFLRAPGRLARELRDEGIGAMKIWPFDRAAERSLGTDIDRSELDQGARIIADIRDAVGDEIEIMLELHGLWHRAPATRIIDRITSYRPYWVEDPLRPSNPSALSRLRADIDVPIATGETWVGRSGFAPLFEAHSIDFVTVDVQWTGGLTEARKIAAAADACGIPVAPHDCTGPATLAASTHLTLSQPNGLIQETVRAFLRTWYDELVEGLPVIEQGRISITDAAGHGVRLRPGLLDRGDVTVRRSAL